MFSYSSGPLSLHINPALSTSFAMPRCSFLRRVVVMGFKDDDDDDDDEVAFHDLEEERELYFLLNGAGGYH